MQKISFARFGKYTDIIAEAMRNLGLNVLPPPAITRRTIELGTKYSPEQICYPFKVTLGTEIEALEAGANAIFMVDTCGWCVLRCYHIVQRQILEDLGYDFDMVAFHVRKPLKAYRTIKRLNPRLTLFRILKEVCGAFKIIRNMDMREKEINKDSPIRIAVLGEIYVSNEEAVNMDIVKKLQDMGAYVDRWLTLWGAIKDAFFADVLKFGMVEKAVKLRRYKKKAWHYFPDHYKGGHAEPNLIHLIKYAEEGYSGAIVLKPFNCNPESIIEHAIEKIGHDYDMPIIQISIDESTLETHFATRIESFYDMLRMRKNGSIGA